ncbi:DUF6776 family protein [Limnobacter litoralis]|uniref:DUF3251 domain-containing protein n=1 Tax=Limnobacter litoralis TaxID=481366 RepID=A0ABQ5YTS8_9BURK|nr:DUF6776 family protein [Limnobacter litoralis]GLR27205.1 hypothetical protein GCM10007875_22960 [Limnobacter litoralis]
MTGRRLKNMTRTFLPEIKRAKWVSYLAGLASGLLILVLIGIYGLLGPETNPVRRLFSTSELSSLHERLQKVESEAGQLREETDRTRELAKLDKDANAKLTLLINNLEAENAKLKEDLAFFEGFIPGSMQGAISLKRLQVNKDTIPGQYRYKALVIQGSQRPAVNLGVQVLVKVLNKDKTDVIVHPDKSEAKDPQFKIKLVRFSRVSGMFAIPPGEKVISVEMRILEDGVIRAQSLLKL